MQIDLRFSVLSFFLIWGAMLLTILAAVCFILDRPRSQTILISIAALAMWTAGTMTAWMT